LSDERVFVVPRSAVVDGAGWHGLRTDGLDGFVAAVERDGRYEARAKMELDPAYKQVIPYLVLRDGERYFLMQRTAAGGDARLHGRYSIGVGGHLNPGDGGLLGGLLREWNEELTADFVPPFRLVGLLNDDATEVGAVHIGAIYVADAGGRRVAVRETEKLSGSFVDPTAVRAVVGRLESWSVHCFDFLESREGAAVR
jgi:predicted NUDIX family phosphoesterase